MKFKVTFQAKEERTGEMLIFAPNLETAELMALNTLPTDLYLVWKPSSLLFKHTKIEEIDS